MSVTFIYGPFAVGKYTVGHCLSNITGRPLLHNHLTVDVAREVFDFASTEYFELAQELRTSIIAKAAKYGQDIIVTFATMHNATRHPFVEQYVQAAQQYDQCLDFVHLIAPEQTLLQRVASPSREAMGKLTDVVDMMSYLQGVDPERRQDNIQEARAAGHLVLDTSKFTAQQAAQRIAYAYQY